MNERLQRLLRPLALLLGVLLPGTISAQTTITILHVGDSHSHLDAFGRRDMRLKGHLGGIAKVATIVAETRASEPNTLFLHAGDAFQGDLLFNAYFGVPELTLLNQLGLDAMVVGNHELDLGPGVLDMALSQAGDVPLVSANLDFSACTLETCGDLSTRILPSRIKDVGGVKIGIFGLTVPGDPLAQPAPIVIRDDVATVTAETVAGLRAAGAQVVIGLSHLGIDYAQVIAANVPGIDFIVSGHDHRLTSEPIAVASPDGKTTLIVAAGAFYENVGRLRFTVDSGQVRFVDYASIAMDKTVPEAPAVQAAVDTLKAGVTQQYGNVYGRAVAWATHAVADTYDAEREARDTGMGNLISDAFRFHTRTDIALTTSGLISEGLASGPLVGADVFRTVSYGYDAATGLGFRMVTFRISGAELLRSLSTCLAAVGLTNAYDVQGSGLSFAYDSRQPVERRLLVDSVMIHGRHVDPSRLYTVTSDQAVVVMLPNMGIAIQDVQVLAETEYEVVHDFVRRLGIVSYGSQGRVRDIAAQHGPRTSAGATVP